MNTLVVITGPTGVGKTDTAISIAQALSAEIISADSRQLYRDIPIGTAAPTAQQQAIVPHHFVGTLALDEYYSAAQFESDVMQLLPTLFKRSPYAVMCGGSMLYIDAVCKGIDDIPTVSDEIRAQVYAQYEQHGLDYMLAQLQELDPEHYRVVDKKNYKRKGITKMPKKVKQGTVVSDKMDKAVVVQVAEHKAHKKYKKTMTFTKNFKVRDMENVCHVGDVVTIIESKPLSGSIRWTLDKVVSVAK